MLWLSLQRAAAATTASHVAELALQQRAAAATTASNVENAAKGLAASQQQQAHSRNQRLNDLGSNVSEQLKTLQTALIELNERSHVQVRGFEDQINGLKTALSEAKQAHNGHLQQLQQQRIEDAGAINAQHKSVVARVKDLENWMKDNIDRIEVSTTDFAKRLEKNIRDAAPMPQSDVE